MKKSLKKRIIWGIITTVASSIVSYSIGKFIKKKKKSFINYLKKD
ncbi:MAG: hypothetical protein ABIH64_01475 [Nanoarchaeota archaeon]